MAKYNLDTDFSTLKIGQRNTWMCEFCDMADEAFSDSDNKAALLGHMLILKAYVNTVSEVLRENNREISPLVAEGMDWLLKYIDKKAGADEFVDFADRLYSCVLCFNTGEELDGEREEFNQKYFDNVTLSPDEWSIMGWIGALLLEISVIEGEQLDFDFFDEFEYVDRIDLFYYIEDILNSAADSFADILQIDKLDKVYETEPFEQLVDFVCSSLKKAVKAEDKEYSNLIQEYSKKWIVPESYAAKIIAV